MGSATKLWSIAFSFFSEWYYAYHEVKCIDSKTFFDHFKTLGHVVLSEIKNLLPAFSKFNPCLESQSLLNQYKQTAAQFKIIQNL